MIPRRKVPVQRSTPPWHQALMFGMALTAGLLLVLLGHQPVSGASAFIAPFLVIFERLDWRSGPANRPTSRRRRTGGRNA